MNQEQIHILLTSAKTAPVSVLNASRPKSSGVVDFFYRRGF